MDSLEVTANFVHQDYFGWMQCNMPNALPHISIIIININITYRKTCNILKLETIIFYMWLQFDAKF